VDPHFGARAARGASCRVGRCSQLELVDLLMLSRVFVPAARARRLAGLRFSVACRSGCS
jgi:hypothetical protein